jgi:uncharacterized protein YyaL (SSP411 family)
MILRSCHWCHVMERECFEDREVAEALNAGYVSVKVDREERPDVDHLYMEACQALTGGGGWPLTCLLDHDRRPFFAGTYFPKDDSHGTPGLLTVLDRIGSLWKSDRRRIFGAAESVMQFLGEHKGESVGKLGDDACEAAYRQLDQSFDSRFGGFGSAPKFPSAHNLLFLLRYGLLHKESRAHEIVRKTLDSMAAGGIFDHIGGGFCRYSTDSRWLVPHFEKMLYDNAMLSMAFAEASAAFGNEAYATVARRIFQYVIREMTQDADSEGEEGKWYLWMPNEIRETLGEADGNRFCGLFDVTDTGNFDGKSIPNLIGKPLSEADRAFAVGCFGRLLERRNRRAQPFKDDKVLASSNGLMIAALALAGRLLHEPEYTARAEMAARFLLDNLVRGGRLQSSWRDGVASSPATSDDYAFFIWGLFELYQNTNNPEWLGLCLQWTDSMLSLFGDDAEGALFLSGSDVSGLPMRPKNLQDGAVPSGNAAAALNLLRLARVTHREEYESKAVAILDALASVVTAWPAGSTALLCTRLYMENLGTEVVIANGENLDQMLKAAEAYLPFTTFAVRGQGYEKLDNLTVNMELMESKEGAATAYLCSKGACQQPLTDANTLKKKLENVF